MDGMTSDAKNIVPPPQRQPVNFFRFSGRVAMALALAFTIVFGPSQISAATPDLNNAAGQKQPHHDEQANAGHHSIGPAASGHHTAAIKVYCNTATPGHGDHAQHGDGMCEGYRVMSSALTSAEREFARYYIRLSAKTAPDSAPAGHSPERLKEPPRTV